MIKVVHWSSAISR